MDTCHAKLDGELPNSDELAAILRPLAEELIAPVHIFFFFSFVFFGDVVIPSTTTLRPQSPCACFG